ncbi:hypothetical protein P43SY_009718 [Pythium insidiosum]|uniref:PhoD-like phosphatase metallophosphatase domain-containing protein n=1 Tax=Pythium insidiosum TaxID=114742 RepID=A0AAD5M5F3_PYTIN|nr:hypothetical protein P43SY_009718 [Pythium insidiosum]
MIRCVAPPLLLLLLLLAAPARSVAPDAPWVMRSPPVASLTAPLQRIGFGSCNDQGMEQPLWPVISQHRPEIWVWMGDNIYGDIRQRDEPKQYFPPKLFHEAPPEVLRRRYAKQLSYPEYQAFVNVTPMIGIWDDHDFGINDGHKGYTYREQSQQIFLDYFNEPLDYHRDEYKQHDGDFLGERQWQWLERELLTSTAAFNVIVSGIQILPADRFFGAESWSRFPHQRERLLELILRSQAKGVILLSGDVHFAEINQVICGDGKATLTEMTSSGMTHSWMQFHFPEIKFFPALIFTFANMLLPWEFRPRHDAFYGFLNWGMIEIDWDHAPHPVARVVVRGRDAQIKLKHTVASVSLPSVDPAKDAASCRPPRELPVLERRFWQLSIVVALALLFSSILFNVVVLLWLVKYAAQRLLRRAPPAASPQMTTTVEKKKKKTQ